MYTCIQEIPGLLDVGATFMRYVPIISKYPEHFENDGKVFVNNRYSITGLTKHQKAYSLRKIKEKFYRLEDIE